MTAEGDRRGPRECRTCHWFQAYSDNMANRYLQNDGTCEIRFPWSSSANGASTCGVMLHSYDRGKKLDSWCSFWLPNLTTM
jgi:hypothetical protein